MQVIEKLPLLLNVIQMMHPTLKNMLHWHKILSWKYLPPRAGFVADNISLKEAHSISFDHKYIGKRNNNQEGIISLTFS